MATPATGQITMDNVRGEMGVSGQIDMNSVAARQLANQRSGQTDMNAYRGKSKPPAAGTYNSQYCSGTTLINRYNDGYGGTYDVIQGEVSGYCGYSDGGGAVGGGV